MTGEAAPPVSADSFAGCMARLGPFEPAPHLAVAVSGGSDSLALTLLADAWCRQKDGRITALTVDHGLRPESGEEAHRVGELLAARGIAHTVLSWRDRKPAAGLQAKARDARYGLLEDWCRRHGVLHLLVAHTADDQAETFLLRLGRGSGPDGLAGMSPVRELAHCRILRPLLGHARAVLREWLAADGQDWIDDPGNADPRFARTRVRQVIASGALPAEALTAAAGRYAGVRQVAELETDRLLARHGRLSAAGFMTFDRAALMAAPPDTALRALARALTCLGGGLYPPRRRALEDLFEALADDAFTSRTLARCRVIMSGEELLICREARHLPAPRELAPGAEFLWDGRFMVKVAAATDAREAPLSVVPGGTARWSEAARQTPAHRQWKRLPAAARVGLPVIADPSGICAAPLLECKIGGPGQAESQSQRGVTIVFRPRRPLSLAAFCVA